MGKFKIGNLKRETVKNKSSLHVKYGELRMLYSNCFIICVFLFVIFAGGCASVKETAKGIMGVSTRELEKNEAGAIKEVFGCEYKVCYNETMGILKNTGAYIYAIDVPKNMVAVYVSHSDTTPVGIFFKKLEAGKTQINISSPSVYGKELVAKNIFTRLKKTCPLKSEKPKG